MSIELIESIINHDFILANDLFEEKLENIKENKLYEVKRSLGEAISKGGEHYMDKEDWAKYRKKTKLPKSPKHEPPAKPFGAGGRLSKGDIERRRQAGYIKADTATKAMKFIQAVKKYKETGKLDEQYPPYIQKAISTAASIPSGPEPETPRDIKIDTKAKAKTSQRSRRAAYRDVARQAKQQATSDWAEKTFRQRAIKRSLKNVLRGKNVMKNVGSLIHHGSETKPGKIATGALSDIASAVAMEE